jgi:hypothetical protein
MAAVIPIIPEANLSEEVADFMLFMLQEDRPQIPKLSLLQIIAAKARPGLNSEILASSVTSRFEEIGIPSGPLEGGTPNVMEEFVKIFSEAIVDAIQNDMRVDVAVDTGVTIQANGANAGGPVASVGASITPHTGTGIAR